MALKKPKVKGKGSKKKQKEKDAKWKEQNSGGEEDEGEDEVCPSLYKSFPKLPFYRKTYSLSNLLLSIPRRRRHSMDLILPILYSQPLYRDITPCWRFFETLSTCMAIFLFLQYGISRAHHA